MEAAVCVGELELERSDADSAARHRHCGRRLALEQMQEPREESIGVPVVVGMRGGVSVSYLVS